MDLNLLPQDLRLKEEKEKQKVKKMPHDLEVELYNPSKANSSAAISGSDKPYLSWWQSLFGLKKTQPATAPVRLTAPPAELPTAPQKRVIGNDWVKKYPAKMSKPLAGESRPRSYFWRNLFGKPALPIITDVNELAKRPALKQPKAFGLPAAADSAGLEIKLTPDKAILVARPAKEKPAKMASIKKVAGDSWLSIFSNLFAFRKKDLSGLKFAGTDNAAADLERAAALKAKAEAGNLKPASTKEPFSSIVKKMEPTKPNLPEKKTSETPVKEKAKEKTKGKRAYHLVPKFEKGNGINVNLLPGDRGAKVRKPVSETRFLAVAILLPMLIITVAYGALWLLQWQAGRDLADRKIQLEDLQQQIGSYNAKEKANNDFANRLATIKKLADQKIIWSNFFTQLERYTLDGVYFTNLTIDTSGVFVLPGIATDYSTLAKQLALFKSAKDFIKDLKITSTQLYSEEKAGVSGVSFQLRLTLQDNLLTLK
jgi:hypothetical protein